MLIETENYTTKEILYQIAPLGWFLVLGSLFELKLAYSLPNKSTKITDRKFEIIKFIDDAYLANLKDVEIIHGKGTGVLRITVHEILKNHDLVKDFNLADIKSGGHGATIVKLKED